VSLHSLDKLPTIERTLNDAIDSFGKGQLLAQVTFTYLMLGQNQAAIADRNLSFN